MTIQVGRYREGKALRKKFKYFEWQNQDGVTLVYAVVALGIVAMIGAVYWRGFSSNLKGMRAVEYKESHNAIEEGLLGVFSNVVRQIKVSSGCLPESKVTSIPFNFGSETASLTLTHSFSAPSSWLALHTAASRCTSPVFITSSTGGTHSHFCLKSDSTIASAPKIYVEVAIDLHHVKDPAAIDCASFDSAGDYTTYALVTYGIYSEGRDKIERRANYGVAIIRNKS